MRLAFCFTLLLLGVGVVRAEAEPFPPIASEEATKHLNEGQTEYDLGRWDEAIQHFEAGARIEDSNKFFWGLAQAHRNAGNLERARWYYERLIARLEGVEGSEEVIDWSRKYIAEIDAKLAAAPAPVPAVEKQVDAPRRFTTTRKIALAVGGTGVVLFAVAGGMVLHARDLRDDADALCPTTACDRADEANALIARSDRNFRNAEITVAVGAGAVAVAVALWFIGKPEKPARGAITAIPYAAPGSAGVDVLVRF